MVTVAWAGGARTECGLDSSPGGGMFSCIRNPLVVGTGRGGAHSYSWLLALESPGPGFTTLARRMPAPTGRPFLSLC